jgi:hypothetical protein
VRGWLIWPCIGLAVAGCGSQVKTRAQASSQALSEQTCAYIALVAPTNPLMVTGVGNVCDTLESGLAHDGFYWSPFTGDIATFSATCELVNGHNLMSVYAGGNDAVSYALQTCSAQEANGWSTDS